MYLKILALTVCVTVGNVFACGENFFAEAAIAQALSQQQQRSSTQRGLPAASSSAASSAALQLALAPITAPSDVEGVEKKPSLIPEDNKK